MFTDVIYSGISTSGDDYSYGQIAGVTFEIVLRTVIICLIGFFAAYAGYFPRDVQKNVSHLNAMVFTPCLIFSKMASSITLSALDDLALIPVLFVLTTGVSYFCGRFLSRVMHLTPGQSNFVTAMAVFGNSNSLPVSLTVSLASSLPVLQWPDIPNDSSNNVVSRGLLYILVFQQLGQMLRWSWGYNTLLAKKPPGADDDDYNTPLANSNQLDIEAGSNDSGSTTPTPQDFSGDENASVNASVGSHNTIVPPTSSFWDKCKSVALAIYNFMNPPLWAMLAALVVAAIPPLRYVLFEKQGFVSRTVGEGVNQVGKVAIPLILIVLGANLCVAEEDHNLPRSKDSRKMVFAALISRMLLPGLVILPVIALSTRYLGISILDDPIFLVSSFILTVSPPAIQLAQICQLNSVYESEMADVLFWGYVVLTLPTSIFIVVFALETLRWSGITV